MRIGPPPRLGGSPFEGCTQPGGLRFNSINQFFLVFKVFDIGIKLMILKVQPYCKVFDFGIQGL